ncbi:MAG TPA: tannase/feruloyl esterase family alpha/beta hydrolase, partial [Pseudonocardiaceae bacterium]|nr:tannase/feruloyl esterase family alpha/beta hydrolase [Pseudonocardiaceae bacterium]
MSWNRKDAGAAVVAVIVAVTGAGSIAGCAASQTTSVIQPVRQCGELVGDAALPEAAVHVTEAAVVPAGAGVLRHCEVRGFIEPAVRFQLKLPTSTFTGRYLQYGCGGFCGVISPAPFADCGQPDGGDVAVGATDDGHTAADDVPGGYGSWGDHNQAARNDWFY